MKLKVGDSFRVNEQCVSVSILFVCFIVYYSFYIVLCLICLIFHVVFYVQHFVSAVTVLKKGLYRSS